MLHAASDTCKGWGQDSRIHVEESIQRFLHLCSFYYWGLRVTQTTQYKEREREKESEGGREEYKWGWSVGKVLEGCGGADAECVSARERKCVRRSTKGRGMRGCWGEKATWRRKTIPLKTERQVKGNSWVRRRVECKCAPYWSGVVNVIS